jgi:CO/xanthine dehydrogenase Mo-binding subunit
MEEMIVKNGSFNPNLTNYLIPTALDVPARSPTSSNPGAQRAVGAKG